MRVLVALVFCVALATAQNWIPKVEDIQQWMGTESDLFSAPVSIPQLRQRFIARLKEWAEDELAKHNKLSTSDTDNPYFRWIPKYLTSIIPDGPTVSWAAPCFLQNTAAAVTNADGSVTITLNLENPTSLFCTDSYLFGTVQSVSYQQYFFHGTQTLQWTLANDTSASELWDLKTKGVRLFRFYNDWTGTLSDILNTVALFAPIISGPGVSDDAASRNLAFMQNYAGFHMSPRNITDVDIDENLIQSGDFFGIVRLDGLDPMLAWAMGSTTGHTTVAIRIDGELYIAESTTKDSYWPTNGIQATPFKTWMALARAADHNLVWAPLSPENRAKFNATAAIEFFKQNEGLDYGYHTILWAWIDTLKDNYPCLPPDYTTCLAWEHVEILFGVVDRLIPALGDLLFNEAWNKRVGTQNLRAADLLYQSEAVQLMPRGHLPTIIEQDSWLYQTTRNDQPAVGKSMVCCVFVCNMWKAGGLFDGINNDLECGELTNWDVYSSKMFDTTTKDSRPQACKDADPDNVLCQLAGKYTVQLNDFNTKAPYEHMAEKCPSLAPTYLKPSDC